MLTGVFGVRLAYAAAIAVLTVLAEILQLADAAFDLLPWRLRHSRHQRYALVERNGRGSTRIEITN
jgi:hypothetical protein